MKKTLLFSVLFLLVTTTVTAQVILNQAGYISSPIGVDTLKITGGTSTFPPFDPAINGTWDMTIVTNTADTMLTYKVPALAPATFADSGLLYFGAGSYPANVEKAITAAGLMEYGIYVDSTAFEINSTVGDTMFIPRENSVYTPTISPRTIIRFPATISSSWGSAYESDFNFGLSYLLPSPSPSYDHAPAIVKSFYTETDTVIGWGKMRVLTITGAVSGYMDVLQVRTQVSRVDTVYLNGGTTDPGLPVLMSFLGVSQGQVTNTFTQDFYRVNEVTPLAHVVFLDSANAFPQSATTHVQRLPAGTVKIGANPVNAAFINVYPNPANDHVITIDAPAAPGEWKYELINAAGQTVTTDALQMSGGHAQIRLGATLASGTYYIRIINNGTQIAVKTVGIN